MSGSSLGRNQEGASDRLAAAVGFVGLGEESPPTWSLRAAVRSADRGDWVGAQVHLARARAASSASEALDAPATAVVGLRIALGAGDFKAAAEEAEILVERLVLGEVGWWDRVESLVSGFVNGEGGAIRNRLEEAHRRGRAAVVRDKKGASAAWAEDGFSFPEEVPALPDFAEDGLPPLPFLDAEDPVGGSSSPGEEGSERADPAPALGAQESFPGEVSNGAELRPRVKDLHSGDRAPSVVYPQIRDPFARSAPVPRFQVPRDPPRRIDDGTEREVSPSVEQEKRQGVDVPVEPAVSQQDGSSGEMDADVDSGADLPFLLSTTEIVKEGEEVSSRVYELDASLGTTEAQAAFMDMILAEGDRVAEYGSEAEWLAEAENLYHLGCSFLDMEAFQDAERAFDQAMTHPSFRMAALEGKTEALMGRGDFGEAYGVADNTIRLFAPRGSVLPGFEFLRAQAASGLGRQSEAEAGYRRFLRALELDPQAGVRMSDRVAVAREALGGGAH